MIGFILESAALHLLFALVYWLFLAKESQFSIRRSYLLISSFFSLVIPFLNIPSFLSFSATPFRLIPNESILLQTVVVDGSNSSNWNSTPFFWIYGVVTGLFLVRFLGDFIYLIILKYRSKQSFCNGLTVYKSQGMKSSFTFLHWIFLNEDLLSDPDKSKVILKHEEAHRQLGHTYDLLFLGLFKVFFWWLPTAWFINREIKKIHEFQADAYALKFYDLDLYSCVLISSVLKSNGLSLASSFHDGLIFKRLKAMKQNAKKVSPLRLGLLSTTCIMIMLVFACNEVQTQQLSELESLGQKDDTQVFEKAEQLPSFDGGFDALYSFIAQNIRYPLEARKAGVEGKVYVEFIVEKDGSLSGVRALNKIGGGCDEEAVRVVKMAPSFTPGKQDGEDVRVRMALPISFKLNPEMKNPDQSKAGMVIIEEARAPLSD